jgi:high-affinity iron transporter
MLQAFVITLREGLEAFLIVAISLAYLRKSGRGELTRAVHTGIVAALAISVVGGICSTTHRIRSCSRGRSR